MNSVEKKTGGKLGSKLTSAVISVMVVGFLMVLAIVAYSIYHFREESEIAAEKLRQENSASQVLLIQSTVRNIGEQLSMNPVFSNVLGDGSDSLGDLLTSKREIHNALSSCAHLYEGINEVLVFSEDGTSFSSREKRGDFIPEENPWFTEFLGRNVAAGFTEPHKSAPAQDGSMSDEISYICEYFTDSGYGKRSFIIVSIRTDVFDKITGSRPALENGCVLYDEMMNPISGSGMEGFDLSLADGNEDSLLRINGDLIFIERDMDSGWTLVSGISGEKLLNQCLGVLLPLLLVIPGVILFMIYVIHDCIQSIVKPLNLIGEAAEKVGRGDFSDELSIHTGDELETTADAFNKMTHNINELMKESKNRERKLQQINLERNVLDMNPHFIFNTTESLVYMARESGNQRITDLTEHFLAFLEQTLITGKSIFISLENELEILKNYLYIQQFIFPDRFDYSFDFGEDVINVSIPMMVMEPVVENAILHGLAQEEKKGQLLISGRREGDLFHITVEDDGIGMSEETIEKIFEIRNDSDYGGTSLVNLRRRIWEIYGEEYGIKIESIETKGTKVILTIPFGVVKGGV